MKALKKFKPITHVIFDMDGVLLDTEQYYTQVAESLVKRYGKSYTWDVKLKVMGKTGIDMARSVVELLELPITPEDYYEQAKEEFRNLMPVARLLPDTEGIYKSVIADIAKRFGKIYTPKIMAKVIGTPERESSRIAVTEMQLPMSVDDFQKEFNKSSHDQFHNLPLTPGADKLINHLKYIKIPMAVATSSHLSSYELKTKPHKELFKAFSHVVCGGDDPEVKRGKPNPDIFLVCASRFPDKPKPEKCLVFEDSPNGVKAAIAAKMQAVMMPDENVPEEMRKQATVVVNCLDETPLEAFGLPPIE